MTALTLDVATRWVRMILEGLHREYPWHLVHVVASEADVRPPRELTPAFYGCFDWHSAVHSHWALVRLLRVFPDAPWRDEVIGAVAKSLTPENMAGEVAYQSVPWRTGFERPYGLAWLLQLAAELRERASPPFPAWSGTLRPLEELAAGRIRDWLPRLPLPIRSGEHSQTAFSLGLCFDWACTAGDDALKTLIQERSRVWYGADRDAPLSYEPSGHDFLSPALGEADLMRRVLPAGEFGSWLGRFLPSIAGLRPVVSPDPSDGKLAHLDGLCLSRAWMLAGIAETLPRTDPRREEYLSCSADHARAGLAAITGEHYAGAHWLGTFGVYLTTVNID